MDTQLINEIKNDIRALQVKLDEITQRNTPKSDVMAEHNLDIALTMYADHLIANYRSWGGDELADRITFDVTFDRGRKFIKVVTQSSGSQRSVHSFICIQPHSKFQFGDILKAATWAQPAKNFARGNVLDPKSYAHHRWTGA